VKLIKPVALLFLLNLIDAIASTGWVRSGITTEANQLMAPLLDLGSLPFLAFKIVIGTLTCGVLLYGAENRVARVGLTVALIIYIGVTGLHLGTGLLAYGFLT
jgi:hypothetical protein